MWQWGSKCIFANSWYLWILYNGNICVMKETGEFPSVMITKARSMFPIFENIVNT